MKDLLEYIVKSLVTEPDAVSIDEQIDDGNVNLMLTVDPSDMGLIIGKSGQTIRSIRKLLTVRAIAENVRVNLQLNEPEGGKPVAANTSDGGRVLSQSKDEDSSEVNKE